MDRVRISKFLSFVLRHRPEAIGARLDAAGFIDVDELLALLRASGRELSRERLFELVASSLNA